ncbi:chondrolectin [Stigmatopora argus]
MDFVRWFGPLVAFLFHNGFASKINGQRICRRGTGRPCYKVSYFQDSRGRLTFQDARQACRADGGELLSIETESEQRLIERFIQQLHAADGDFWIGLRRGPQRFRTGNANPGCPSQYFWLDGSKAKFRNWHWDEPSCGGEMCGVLYYQPSAPDEEGHFLFQWNDDNCNTKNNYVCKYPKEKASVFTEAGKGNAPHAVPTVTPNLYFSTKSGKTMKEGIPESSVSFSDSSLYIPYILYATIPALLLLLLAVSGFFCYKQAQRRKSDNKASPSQAKPWMPTEALSCPIQGPYAFSDITKLSHRDADGTLPADFKTKYPHSPSREPQWNNYENVLLTDRESGFVSNDIYETSGPHGGHHRPKPGWVENEIYG